MRGIATGGANPPCLVEKVARERGRGEGMNQVARRGKRRKLLVALKKNRERYQPVEKVVREIGIEMGGGDEPSRKKGKPSSFCQKSGKEGGD